MGLPPFFSRVADALRPVTEVSPEALAEKLDSVAVELHLPPPTADPHARDAAELAGNLLARLYPSLDVYARADDGFADAVAAHVRSINPDIHLTVLPHHAPAVTADRADPEERHAAVPRRRVALVFGQLYEDTEMVKGRVTSRAARDETVLVDASGWVAAVDQPAHDPDAAGPRQPGQSLAWLAAAAVGVGEVFRTVFADELGARGRRGSQPGRLDLLGERASAPLDAGRPDGSPVAGVDIGHVHLAGAGAVGQAFVLALRTAGVQGHLTVVEPETITLSNLQRYVLTTATSVDAPKGQLVVDALADAPLTVEAHTARWGDRTSHSQVAKVAVALDSARDRIGVAATLPGAAYNAWTQVADLGWSRHEQFGTLPCLACLYYPSATRPSDHELIAAAIAQPALRVLGYLVYNQPIGFPLPHVPAIPDLPAADDAHRWLTVPLVDDLAAAGVLTEEERAQWANSTVGALYRNGVCAGGVMAVGDLPGEVLVPLAHQSALAGIMLALEVIASTGGLRDLRDGLIEHRFDVLRGFPQVVGRPRGRTPGCLCADSAYIAAARQDTA